MEKQKITPEQLANIHWFAVPDGILLLDVNSGSVLRIDEETAACLERLRRGEYLPEDAPIVDELCELR